MTIVNGDGAKDGLDLSSFSDQIEFRTRTSLFVIPSYVSYSNSSGAKVSLLGNGFSYSESFFTGNFSFAGSVTSISYEIVSGFAFDIDVRITDITAAPGGGALRAARMSELAKGSSQFWNELLSHDDTITGSAFRDYLYGFGGDDRILGGRGSDLISGGLGADTLFGEDDGDFVFGSAGDDVIYGGRGGDKLYGEDGADFIFGGDDADTLYGDAGNDSLFGDSGDDTIYGGAGDDTIRTGPDSKPQVYGGEGKDTIWLDQVPYRTGAVLDGGGGVDTLRLDGLQRLDVRLDAGALYWDAYAIAAVTRVVGIENVHGSPTADSLRGDSGSNTLVGNGGDDSVAGGGGDDNLSGGAGRDRLLGDAGADRLTGGADRDVLIGGSGPDTFVYQSASDSAGSQRDLIEGFERGATRDRIDLSAIDAVATVGGNQGFSTAKGTGLGQLSFVDLANGNTLVRGNIDADATFEIEIEVADGGVAASAWSPSADFVL